MEALFDIPNLDDLSVADYRLASSVLGRLACYADYKARAMELRVAGDIEAALGFERACEYQYKQLPEWARW